MKIKKEVRLPVYFGGCSGVDRYLPVAKGERELYELSIRNPRLADPERAINYVGKRRHG